MVERPTLEEVPELDTEGWTETQIQALSDVLAVYNLNMGRLAIYAQSLESKLSYYDNIIEILTEGR